ncbi:uncharacterized protein LOC111637254 isoform X2 [Centruroides sculpturatus]|uniref:uncharacterized protein LOC111637254 isoform X2 n=1 Tax=Centruroides sculpturatus TaxID=218467 RepID=UPI000C6DE843|nr:uncharacterized protein LOC111637254 isoform X2 [Centruroides sculpturatus]
MDHSNIGENVSVTPEEEGNGNNSSARNNDVEAYRKSVNAGIYVAVTSFLAYSVIIPIIKIIAGARCLGKLEGDKYLVPCLIAGGALMLCRTLLDIIIELIKVIKLRYSVKPILIFIRTVVTTFLIGCYLYVYRSRETFPSGPPHCEIIRDMFLFSPITEGLNLVCFNLSYHSLFYKLFPCVSDRIRYLLKLSRKCCCKLKAQSASSEDTQSTTATEHLDETSSQSTQEPSTSTRL